jgi:transcriptional regulator GlxA family with amidase domain
MHHVVALALPRVVAFDLAIPAQVFGHRSQRGYRFTLCAPQAGPVATTTGFALIAEHGLNALGDADTVLVPGFEPETSPLPEPVLAALRAADARGARMVSICTGAFALAGAGVLDGRRATTHWQAAARLAERHPAVRVTPDVLYVDEGRVLTSAGVAAGIDLCLHIVRRDHGAEVASAVARRMVIAPHRAGGQAQYFERPVPAGPGGLEATRAWALQRLAEPLGVRALARHAGYSERSFARHFRAETGTTPLQWLLAQRLLEARRLLESTALPVETVAARTGFGSATSLRTHFRRALGTTPTAYRTTWQGAGPDSTFAPGGR